MEKIQIKGLVQGTRKRKDGSFAVGLKTKWGILWLVPEMFPRFFVANSHLKDCFMPYTGVLDLEEFIGRYIFVSNKAQEAEWKGCTFSHPII